MALETRTIAALGRTVTRLGLGALPMGPLQRGLSTEEGGRVIRAALEAGITYLDTATVYGTYEHLAWALEGWTGEVTLSTKTHARDDGALARQHIELALRSLKRDTLDIMLCHCARTAYSDEMWGPSLEALLEAKDKGLIRMVGVSCHSVEGVRVATAMPDIDVIHPMINLTGLGIVGGTRDEMLAAIREAHAAGKFIYAMKALAGGNLVNRREEALRYVFDLDCVDVVAVGMVTPAEVEWNVRWASGEEIPADLAQATALHSKRLSILQFVCNGCGSCVEHCENDALHLVEGKSQVDPERCILCGYCAPHCPLFAIRMV